MQTSERGIVALISHEGIVPGPYRDSVGVWTAYVGHTAAAGAPNPATLPRGMPDNLDAALVEVFDVFRRDLQRYEAAVSAAIKVPVTQHEFDAAVSFHFNTGAIGRATWVKSLNAGRRSDAAGQIMAWKKPAAIIPRRAAEQALFRDGTYPTAGVNVWGVDPGGRVIWRPVRRLLPSEALALLRGASRPDHTPPVPPASIFASIIRAFAALFGRK